MTTHPAQFMPQIYRYNANREWPGTIAFLALSTFLFWLSVYSSDFQNETLNKGFYLMISLAAFLYVSFRIFSFFTTRRHWRLVVDSSSISFIYKSRTGCFVWADVQSVEVERVMIKVGVYEDFLRISASNSETLELKLQDFIIPNIAEFSSNIKELALKYQFH